MAEHSSYGDRAFNAASYFGFLRDDKKLMGVSCRACGELSAVPRPICTACHGQDLEWRELSGRATLSTFTCISIVPVAMGAKGYGRDNPYCTGIVALEEGPKLSARIVGVDGNNPQDIKTGLDLVVDLEETDPDDPSPVFRPA